MLQIVGVAAAEINQQSCSLLYTNSSALHFLCQELAHLLLYVTHMFQSGEQPSNTLISQYFYLNLTINLYLAFN